MCLNKFLPCSLFVLVFILSAQYSYADHLKGGWMKYKYLSETSSTIQYQVSFYQYSDCSEPGKVDNEIYLAIYDASNNNQLYVDNIALTTLTTESKNDFGPCFQNPPTICYLIAEYTTNITVPKNAGGYVLSVQRCCRIAGIENVPESNTAGLTYTVTIAGGNTSNNNSPVFEFNDANAVCFSSPFTYDFSAKDVDGDSLVYSLCSGLTGGTQFDPVVENPGPPPYASIPYISPYSGAQPLGASVSIDRQTGRVSGYAPQQTGTYVVAVCVNEYRNGVYISHTRKELHLDVSNCKFGGAQLDPSYITCNGYDFTFTNNAGDNPNYSYLWDFGVDTLNTDTSSLAHPTYTYPDTGNYHVKLKAKNNLGCEDSAETQVKIFPGFNTDFSIDGSCILNPYNFTDLTTTKYGYIDSWKWFFGETEELNDTTENTAYTYPDPGPKTVTLIATNSKGCIDTASRILTVLNGPDLSLNFNDTLICSIDTLQLKSFSINEGAVFSWTPSYNILGSSTNQPQVYPKKTTTYNVNVSYKGCVSSDSVTVNVIDNVALNLPADTIICKTDSIQIIPATNALYFSWSPAQGLNSTANEQPVATPLSNTKYSLLASVGKCFATDAINIMVVPYPAVNAGADATICYGDATQLNANIEGTQFSWSPAQSLVNPTTLSPIAGPQFTTEYILRVTDTIGCPKPVEDTIIVNIIPKVMAFAGNDTNVVRTQALQLNATGGTYYRWFPTSNLSNPNIANPIATFTDGPDTVTYTVKVSTPEGCFANDSMKVFVFNTPFELNFSKAEIYIPTAFTPDGDGRNDVFRPILAGIKQLLYFRVYNRWGQLLFSTSEQNKGWDGRYNGILQASGTYVYDVEAIDYKIKPFSKKGTFVLIR